MRSVSKYLNLKILFFLYLAAVILCFIIPAGTYEYDKNGSVIPNSFHYLDGVNLTLSQILTAPVDGFLGVQNDALHIISTDSTGVLSGAILLIFLILSIGAFIYVANKLKILEIFIEKTLQKKVNIYRVTIYISLFFVINASLQGMYETALGFAPLIYLFYRTYDIDNIFILKLMLYSLSIGYIGGLVNPFATLIGLNQAGLTLEDGFFTRLLLLLILTIVVQIILILSLKKAKIKNFRKYNDNFSSNLSKKEIINLLIFFSPFIIMILGLLPLKGIVSNNIPTSYLNLAEITMIFFITTFILAYINKMKTDEIIDNILYGFSTMSGVVIAIGFARSIYVLMYNAKISDTIIYFTSKFLNGKSLIFIIIILAIFYLILTILVPSSSALAFLTIPILSSTFKVINLDSILVVNVYLCMIGVGKMISITSPVVIGLCTFFEISYGKWVKESIIEVSILMIISLFIVYIAYLI